MINLPSQIKDKNFRFIRLGNKGKYLKIPIEEWREKYYSFNSEEIQKHKGNVGVICGGGLKRIIRKRWMKECMKN